MRVLASCILVLAGFSSVLINEVAYADGESPESPPPAPSDSDSDSGQGDAWLDSPVKENTYCDGLSEPHTFHAVGLTLYEFADGKSAYLDEPPTGADGRVPLYRFHTVWCEPPPSSTNLPARLDFVFLPYVTPVGVAYSYNLLAKVKAQLVPATVVWRDSDAEHDWLWVNVEHTAAIEPLPSPAEEKYAGNALYGYAHAWIRAKATSVTLRLPGVKGANGIAECDLKRATGADGCKVSFSHSSSIDPSGAFHGTSEVTWTVSSNSGKYDGVTFTTEGTFSVRVAEAMAVSGSG